jgi:Spy/CpxP family protein refolding chaperone
MLKRLVFAAVMLGSVGLLSVHSPLTGQDAKEKKARGRLPAYYTDIVTAEQRQKIYDVQSKYAKQIEALNEQLEALQRQRDGEIENMLTADQKDRLKKAREEGATKKKKMATDKKVASDEGTQTSAESKSPPTRKVKTK